MQRSLIALPDESSLPVPIIERLKATEAILQVLGPVSLCSAEEAVLDVKTGRSIAEAERLFHELSPWITARSDPRRLKVGRSRLEAWVLSIREEEFRESITVNEFEGFTQVLEEICSDLRSEPMTLRKADVSTNQDSEGAWIKFPAAHLVPRGLEALWRQLNSRRQGGAMFQAAVAMVSIANCHPFLNGNGRLSRLLFNFVLRERLGLGDQYLPLYETMAVARGGFEIRLRQAELRGEWEPLLGFLCDAVEFQASYFGHLPRGSKARDSGGRTFENPAQNRQAPNANSS